MNCGLHPERLARAIAMLPIETPEHTYKKGEGLCAECYVRFCYRAHQP